MGEAGEADRGEMGAGKYTAPVAKQEVCRQTPEVGAVCVNAHVRICAGGEGKPSFLPQPSIPGKKPAMFFKLLPVPDNINHSLQREIAVLQREQNLWLGVSSNVDKIIVLRLRDLHCV